MESGVKYLCEDWLENWPESEAGILEALKYSATDDNIFDVMSALHQQRAFLWKYENNVCVTVFDGRDYTIWLFSSEMNKLKDMMPFFEKHAAGLDASEVVVFGRKGWTRSFLSSIGYATTHVVMRKDLRGT